MCRTASFLSSINKFKSRKYIYRLANPRKIMSAGKGGERGQVIPLKMKINSGEWEVGRG